MPETMSQNLADALCALLDHGYEVTLAKDPRDCGYLADLEGPLGSHVTGMGDSPAAALATVWPLDLDDKDHEDEPYCYTCGLPVGIFQGHGDGWHHWRGKGTAENPVELYDAGHAPEVAWRPAGAR
ncbi:MAG: hypothetical protein ACRDPY_44035 [Streptosporangiaceae bacterium]